MQFGAENTASWERGGESDAGLIKSFKAFLALSSMLDPCSHSGVLSLTTHGRGAFLQFGFVTLLEEAVLVLEARGALTT